MNGYDQILLPIPEARLDRYRQYKGKRMVFGMRPEFPTEGKILILANPPFGDRLAPDASIPTLYAKLGKYFHGLAQKHPGRILGGCLCPDELTWKKFLSGLEVETPETHHFTHGGKEMRIVRWRA